MYSKNLPFIVASFSVCLSGVLAAPEGQPPSRIIRRQEGPSATDLDTVPSQTGTGSLGNGQHDVSRFMKAGKFDLASFCKSSSSSTVLGSTSGKVVNPTEGEETNSTLTSDDTLTGGTDASASSSAAEPTSTDDTLARRRRSIAETRLFEARALEDRAANAQANEILNTRDLQTRHMKWLGNPHVLAMICSYVNKGTTANLQKSYKPSGGTLGSTGTEENEETSTATGVAEQSSATSSADASTQKKRAARF